jgi:hypothetical protein
MSALGSSTLAFDPAGFPILASAGANLALVNNTPSAPIVLGRVPKSGIYSMLINGYVNGGANAITRFNVNFFSDIAETNLVARMMCAVPLGALQGDPCPINMVLTTYLPASGADVALYALTAQITSFGAGGTIYNAMPNAAVAGQGMGFYWQSDSAPIPNIPRIPDFIRQLPSVIP